MVDHEKAYTLQDLRILESALAQGVTSVLDSFGNSITYRSFEDMRKAISYLKARLYPKSRKNHGIIRFR